MSTIITHRQFPNYRKYEMELACPCHHIRFHLAAKPIHRDENGIYNGKSIRPKAD